MVCQEMSFKLLNEYILRNILKRLIIVGYDYNDGS